MARSLPLTRHSSLRSGLRLAALYVASAGTALAAIGLALAQVAIPPVARVTDLTGTLSAEQRTGLEQRLAAFEQQKGSQVAVLVVPTTQPEEIEQYGIRVAEAWKLGRKGVDDGVILIVAKDDHRLRIEVGYGLEGAMPDAIAKRIVAETITPYFRNNDFAGGIDAGIDQILKVIQGEPLPEPKRSARSGDGHSLNVLFNIGFFMLVFSQFIGRAIGEVPSSLAAGGVFGVIAWFLVGVVGAAALAAIILFVVSLVFQLGRGTGGSGGGWSSGAFGGGSFGGGGGFSGGGGGFGGGGASGSW